MNFLVNRKITLDAISKFSVGYCNSELDRYHDRIMFPIFNEFSELQAYQGRALFDYRTANTGKYLHDYGFDKMSAIFGLDVASREIIKQDFCVVNEGPIDAITGWICGLPSVAILGTAFSKKQAFMLRQFTRNILWVIDNDEAGNKAFNKARPIFDALDMRLEGIIPPKGNKDLNELYVNTNRNNVRRIVNGY